MPTCIALSAQLCARRVLRDVEHEHNRVSLSTMLAQAKKAWHGAKLNEPDWGDHSHSVAFGGELRSERLQFHLILNAYWKPLDFELPKVAVGRSWQRWIDTALESPLDISPWQSAPPVAGDSYRVESHSVVMLFAEGGAE